MKDDGVFAHYPTLAIDRDNIEHYRALAQGKLLINRCVDCGYWIYPHRPLCPQCWSWNVKPSEVSGFGKVFLVTLIHQLRDPASQIMEPIAVAAVELVEQDGLRYLAEIVDCPPDQVALDMVVALKWVGPPGQERPVFAPLRQQGDL